MSKLTVLWHSCEHFNKFFLFKFFAHSCWQEEVLEPLPLLYAGAEWCASQQLCEGITRVSEHPSACSGTVVSTLTSFFCSNFLRTVAGRKKFWSPCPYSTQVQNCVLPSNCAKGLPGCPNIPVLALDIQHRTSMKLGARW